jgi:hypothetical protein
MACAAVAQLTLTVVAFAAIDGRIAGVPGRTGGGFTELGFIDRGTDDGDVTWVDNEPRAQEGAADNVQRTAMLYNDGVRQRLSMEALHITPDNFPLDSLPLSGVRVAPSTGRLLAAPRPPVPTPYVVQTTQSPFLQIDGRRLSTSRPLRLEVLRAAEPLRATWLATGLAPDGTLPAGRVAELSAWRSGDVRLRLVAPAPARVRLTLGAERREVELSPGVVRVVTLSACGVGRGRLRATGSVLVQAVEVRRGRCR